MWTRELIDAVLAVGGTYYLPYQPHATPEQFHRAYPRAQELFALKTQLDPEFQLRNVLWDKYYAPPSEPRRLAARRLRVPPVYGDTKWHDALLPLPAERLPPLSRRTASTP